MMEVFRSYGLAETWESVLKIKYVKHAKCFPLHQSEFLKIIYCYYCVYVYVWGIHVSQQLYEGHRTTL